MKTLLLSITLLCTSNICTITAQQKQSYRLSEVEYINDTYHSKMTLTYNDGKLIRVTDKSSDTYHEYSPELYEFDYSQIDNHIVTMTNYYENQIEYYITLYLDSDGAVEKAIYDDREWYEFYYNSDKQLSRMVQHNEDLLFIETTSITYNNGSLVKVVHCLDEKENEGEDFEETFYMTYTSKDIPIPIENRTGVMYKCDILWGIDLDEFNFVYMAGLLGKAPTYLPISRRSDDSENIRFKWKLDNNGIPTECSCVWDSDSYNYYYGYKYSWTTTETGINTITENTDVPTIDATYTINGTKIKNQQKGLNIIRYSDGTTRKRILK